MLGLRFDHPATALVMMGLAESKKKDQMDEAFRAACIEALNAEFSKRAQLRTEQSKSRRGSRGLLGRLKRVAAAGKDFIAAGMDGVVLLKDRKLIVPKIHVTCCKISLEAQRAAGIDAMRAVAIKEQEDSETCISKLEELHRKNVLDDPKLAREAEERVEWQQAVQRVAEAQRVAAETVAQRFAAEVLLYKTPSVVPASFR